MKQLTLRIKAGDSVDAAFTWKDTSGNVYDLSGCTARVQIRPSVADEDPNALPLLEVTEVSSASGQVILGSTSPNLRIVLDKSVTRNSAFEGAVFDIEVTFTDGTRKSLPQGAEAGKVEYLRDVSK